MRSRRFLAACALLGMMALPFLFGAMFFDGNGRDYRLLPALHAEQRAVEGFVGSGTCATCHAAQHAAWQSSDHARAMSAATPATVLGDFSGITMVENTQRATFLRDGERFIVRTEGEDGREAEFTVTETFGLDPLQQYLVLFPDGRRQPLPWAWDSRPREAGGQRWYHLTQGEALHSRDPLHWTGRDQNWNFMCAACHTTGLQRGYDAPSRRYETGWTELGVGCESCHGRGAAHVAWARAGAAAERPDRGLEVRLRDHSGGAWRFAEGDARGIAHWEGPPRQDAAMQVETCAACHARARPIVVDPPPGARFLDTHAPALLEPGLYHADGQIQGEVFEWGSFAQSRMQRAGVVCGDCHTPHSSRLRAEGNAVCAQCHLPARFDTAAHHHHAEGTPAAQCVACHMPAVTYMGVDRRRDHGFRVLRPDIATAIEAPDACTSCHTDRRPEWAAAQVASWFGPQRREHPHPALAIAAGRRGEAGADVALARIATDRSQPAILRATAITLLPMPPSQAAAQAVGATLLDPEPLVRATALRALEGLHPRNRLHAARLLADPVRLVRIEAARALAPVPLTALPEASRPAFARAWEELLASERVAAERPEAHVNIAGLLAARGDMAGADLAYRAALAIDAAYLPALVNMAGVEEARGRAQAAEALLRRAIAAHPGEAEPSYALALLYVRQGRADQALAPAAHAAAVAVQEPRNGYLQALILQRLGRGQEAEAVLASLLANHPRHRDSLVTLATMQRDRGDLSAAERNASVAAGLSTSDREAATLLAGIRAALARSR